MRGGDEKCGQQQQAAATDDRVDPSGRGGRHQERNDHLRPRTRCSQMPSTAPAMKMIIVQQRAFVNIHLLR
ncbi:hypothetical protein Asi03nite_00840 [Actinoplanes siamensis]|uniref:Uncharacterized protein n=1 Tax=Actinoplanes siamensis TaxID=1223317 RepID=A0A919N1W8_9ACTN|nr:hypothetical protein Asi03nite_00840 [Actinoplanes siamensis]